MWCGQSPFPYFYVRSSIYGCQNMVFIPFIFFPIYLQIWVVFPLKEKGKKLDTFNMTSELHITCLIKRYISQTLMSHV